MAYILDLIPRFITYLYHVIFLFDLPWVAACEIASWGDPERTRDHVQSLFERWGRCVPMLLMSFAYVSIRVHLASRHATYDTLSLNCVFRLFGYLTIRVLLTYTDPVLYAIVGLGVATTINAALVTSTFAAVLRKASRTQGTDGVRALRRLAKVSHRLRIAQVIDAD